MLRCGYCTTTGNLRLSGRVCAPATISCSYSSETNGVRSGNLLVATVAEYTPGDGQVHVKPWK